MPYPITVSKTSIYSGKTHILLTINVNTGYNLVTIDAKSKGMIPNLFIKTGNHTATIQWTIDSTTIGRDLVSYRYQSEARNYPYQIKGR